MPQFIDTVTVRQYKIYNMFCYRIAYERQTIGGYKECQIILLRVTNRKIRKMTRTSKSVQVHVFI